MVAAWRSQTQPCPLLLHTRGNKRRRPWLRRLPVVAEKSAFLAKGLKEHEQEMGGEGDNRTHNPDPQKPWDEIRIMLPLASLQDE